MIKPIIYTIVLVALLILTVIIVGGCSNEKTEDDIFNTGKEVVPPYGCLELRKRGGEC